MQPQRQESEVTPFEYGGGGVKIEKNYPMVRSYPPPPYMHVLKLALFDIRIPLGHGSVDNAGERRAYVPQPAATPMLCLLPRLSATGTTRSTLNSVQFEYCVQQPIYNIVIPWWSV